VEEFDPEAFDEAAADIMFRWHEETVGYHRILRTLADIACRRMHPSSYLGQRPVTGPEDASQGQVEAGPDDLPPGA
jgi:hypothetical protein